MIISYPLKYVSHASLSFEKRYSLALVLFSEVGLSPFFNKKVLNWFEY